MAAPLPMNAFRSGAQPSRWMQVTNRVIHLWFWIAALASASAQTIAITAPAANAMISGTPYTLAATVSNAPNACSVEWLVNGDPQGIVFSPPWSLVWNTNNRFNSGGPWHHITAILRDCLGNRIATTAHAFGISNNYLEAPAYISLASVTTSNGSGGSGCNGSTWGGTCRISWTVSGTNSRNLKIYTTLVDGIVVDQQQDQTATSGTSDINTRQFQNGPHMIGFYMRDQTNPAQISDSGFPFGEWQQMITFSNGATSMEVRVGPREAVIAPAGKLKLTCAVGYADGSAKACPAPSYSSGDATVCTVDSSGVVTGVKYGTCPITAGAGGLSRTIFEYVSSANIIPHFSTSGIVKSNGPGIFVTSMFANTANVGFSDPFVPQSVFAAAYQAAGFNTIEGGIVAPALWGTSQSNFLSSLSPLLTSTASILNTYNLNFIGDTESLWVDFYTGVRGLAGTYNPPGWQLLAQTWKSGTAGHLLGFTAFDEGTNAYAQPVMSPPNAPEIRPNGPFTGITCNTALPVICTVAWTNPTRNGPGKFAIFGGTTSAVLNSRPGGPLYEFKNWGAQGFQFQAPRSAAGIQITSASDPALHIEPFASEWKAGGDYLHYQDFAMVGNLLAKAGVPMCGAPAASAFGLPPLAFTNALLYSWIGNPDLDSCGNIYYSPTTAYNPQFEEINVNIEAQSGNPSLSLLNNMRVGWGAAQAPPALLSIVTGTTMDYGFTPVSIPIASISGRVVTFAKPHGLANVIPSIARMAGTGSSNPYFNVHMFIDSCPTATTCNISLAAPAGRASVPQTPNPGTITFSNGDTISHVFMCSSSGTCGGGSAFYCSTGGAGDCVPNASDYSRDYGLTFTWSGGGADPYYTSHTFIWSDSPTQARGHHQGWREVPASAQVSGPMTGLVNADNDYHRGVQVNSSEAILGPRMPFATIISSALTGASGIRDYSLGGNYTLGVLAGTVGLKWNSKGGFDVQASATPLYTNGEAGTQQAFWATASANLLLQRFATSGYLYAARNGCPDMGGQTECSMRSSSKGNLLLTFSAQDYPQTRTVDLAACMVNGQPIIKYSADWRGIDVSLLRAGIASDTATWQPGMAILYLCAVDASKEFAPVTLSADLADVANAARIVVRYSHVPYMLNERTNNVVDCGTGACSIPWDRKVGPLYYQIQYLNSEGAVLATSDLQTL